MELTIVLIPWWLILGPFSNSLFTCLIIFSTHFSSRLKGRIIWQIQKSHSPFISWDIVWLLQLPKYQWLRFNWMLISLSYEVQAGKWSWVRTMCLLHEFSIDSVILLLCDPPGPRVLFSISLSKLAHHCHAHILTLRKGEKEIEGCQHF